MQPRRLLLIRHAQAADAPVDRDRPLTAHGARTATAIGAWLAQTGFAPDGVVVSPALRTRQTWERAAAALTSAPDPDVDDRIYDNTVESVLEAITGTDGEVQTLVVVGHNPSMGRLAYDLDDGDGDADAQRRLHAAFPTGAVAVFHVPGALADLAAGGATLTRFEVPTA